MPKKKRKKYSVKPKNRIVIEYDYAHVPTIREFSRSNKFIRALMGPFGSGKSSGCVIEILRRAVSQKPDKNNVRKTRWAVVRNTYPMLRDTTIKTFMHWLPPQHFGTYRESTHDYIMAFPLEDGTKVCCEILFRALDRPEHVRNLLSMELTGAWINEAREIPRAVFDALQGRVGRYPSKTDGGPTWFGIILDTNPPDTEHWFYKFFEEEKIDNAQLFKQPSGLSDKAENITNLPGNYYQNLAVGKDEDFVRVYIHGQYGFVREGKPVYPEYSDSVHCAKADEIKPITSLPLVLAFDFGLTPAAVLVQRLPSGRVVVLREYISENIGLRSFLENVVKPDIAMNFNSFELHITGDPAGKQRAQTDEKTCFDIIEQIFGIRGVPASTNEIQKRLDVVKQLLTRLIEGKPALMITDQCKTLRKGFMGRYCLRRLKTNEEKYYEVPDKNEFSHVHDALQYACLYLEDYDITRIRPVTRQDYSNIDIPSVSAY